MDIKKYDELRKKVKERDFETKNMGLDRWFFKSTYLGNIGSIFFAFFLVQPALEKAIGANLTSGGSSTILAMIFTIIILGFFEYIKRTILSNLSLDLIRTKWNLFNKNVSWWFLLSIIIVGGSTFLSVNGARKFSDTSKKKNIVIENNIETEIDSITNVFNKRKEVIINDNDKLRKSSNDLRDRIAETPLNYRTVRNEYQDIIDVNTKQIENNDKRINELDSILLVKIKEFEIIKEDKIYNNINEDTGNIILFILISATIEFIIIFGIWFREYYDYNVFILSESKLESIHKKRKNYKVLLQFVYKNGILGQDEQIISISKLKEMIKDKALVSSPNKLVDDFVRDCTYLGILKLVGKKRFTNVSFDEAIKKINNFDDTIRVLENLS